MHNCAISHDGPEVAGFDVFSRSDHYLDGGRSAASTDALTSLAGLGRDTTSIKLNVLVTPASFRHPANLAKTAATVDEISEGRLELGVGHRLDGVRALGLRVSVPGLARTLRPVRRDPRIPSRSLRTSRRGVQRRPLPALRHRSASPADRRAPDNRRRRGPEEDTDACG